MEDEHFVLLLKYHYQELTETEMDQVEDLLDQDLGLTDLLLGISQTRSEHQFQSLQDHLNYLAGQKTHFKQFATAQLAEQSNSSSTRLWPLLLAAAAIILLLVFWRFTLPTTPDYQQIVNHHADQQWFSQRSIQHTHKDSCQMGRLERIWQAQQYEVLLEELGSEAYVVCDPGNLLLAKGLAYIKLGRGEEAVPVFDQLLLFPKHPTRYKALLMKGFALLIQNQGQPQAATSYFQGLLQEEGTTIFEENALDQARKYLKNKQVLESIHSS